METKFGFAKFSIQEFQTWIASISVSRTVSVLQQHHTWSPNYAQFNGSNHFEMQSSMKNHHVGTNGWADIGQHFSIFPDGAILTGRPLNRTPACIYGNNDRSVCIENVGNFDANMDAMTAAQRDAKSRAAGERRRDTYLWPTGELAENLQHEGLLGLCQIGAARNTADRHHR